MRRYIVDQTFNVRKKNSMVNGLWCHCGRLRKLNTRRYLTRKKYTWKFPDLRYVLYRRYGVWWRLRVAGWEIGSSSI